MWPIEEFYSFFDSGIEISEKKVFIDASVIKSKLVVSSSVFSINIKGTIVLLFEVVVFRGFYSIVFLILISCGEDECPQANGDLTFDEHGNIYQCLENSYGRNIRRYMRFDCNKEGYYKSISNPKRWSDGAHCTNEYGDIYLDENTFSGVYCAEHNLNKYITIQIADNAQIFFRFCVDNGFPYYDGVDFISSFKNEMDAVDRESIRSCGIGVKYDLSEDRESLTCL